MSTGQLPKTDSVSELARFWDTHDLTDFEDQLEEVPDKVFDRRTTFTLQLQREAADALRRMAESKGFSPSTLIEMWVAEKIGPS